MTNKFSPFSKTFFILYLFSLFTAIPVIGQVTIGNNDRPITGALLDLKEHIPDQSNSTASRGLGMPRVALKVKNDLKPCVLSATPDDELEHTGLIVYNTEITTELCPGLYIWSGDQWNPIRNYKCFFVEADPKEIYFEADETQKTASLSWAPKSNILTINKVDTGTSGGIRNLSYTTSTSTIGGQATLNITAQAMTTAETASTTIIDRATRLDIVNKLSSGESVSESIMLYQRNGWIDVEGGSNPKACSYYMNGSTYSFSLKTTRKWEVTIKSDPNNIIKSITKTSGEGSMSGENFEFSLIDDVTSPSIYMADAILTFKSPDGRFEDQDISIKGVSYWVAGNRLIDFKDIDTAKTTEAAARSRCNAKGMRVPTIDDLDYIYKNKGTEFPCSFNFINTFYGSNDWYQEGGGDGGMGYVGRWTMNIYNGQTKNRDMESDKQFYRCVKDK